MLPDQPLPPLPELLKIISPEEGRNRLITPKNFYLRLVAETGLLGTATFLAFFIAVASCTLFCWFSPDSTAQYFGLAGMLGLILFAFSAFSFDSFAIPNMWVLFGLISASALHAGGKIKPA
jgi:O-antigen ligase